MAWAGTLTGVARSEHQAAAAVRKARGIMRVESVNSQLRAVPAKR